MEAKMSRRHILKLITLLSAGIFLKPICSFAERLNLEHTEKKLLNNLDGTSQKGKSRVFCARNNSPKQNMDIVLEMLGGIDLLIDNEDIVIIKPNAQWWNQGTTNTNAIKAFIEAILKLPNFTGEIIIAENHQYNDPNSRGWTTEHRNGDFNLNELVSFFQGKGYSNVTKYHWMPVTPQSGTKNPEIVAKAKIVEGPWQGDGYVYDERLFYESPLKRRCLLSYPVFTSSFSGVTVDFKNGAWRDGDYTKQPVKFINFAGINHHGDYAGVTASVKNYMGVVDMSCGTPRGGPAGYYNLHHIGIRDYPGIYQKMPWRLKQKINAVFNISYRHKYFYHTGAALASFMKQIRMADMNFITAHWVGYGSRTDVSLSDYPKALVAGKDPVALDYWSGKNIILPLTKKKSRNAEFLELNDPANRERPYFKFLRACHQQGIGILDKNMIDADVIA